MREDIKEILISEEQLKQRVIELAEQINNDYKGKIPYLVCILRGAIVFLSDLMKNLNVPHKIDFIALSSYGGTTESSGIIRFIKDLRVNIHNHDVILIEDIIDTGLTLQNLLQVLELRHPNSLKTCVLLDKKARRKVDISADYIGFEIPDEFVVGYGLDYYELYRNLPFIGILKPEIIDYGMNKKLDKWAIKQNLNS